MFIKKLPENTLGRDIIVGDIHGMMDAFWDLMEQAKFNPLHDRVISVGDLVDRGPDSLEAVVLLDEPWFYAVRGNHEDFFITSVFNAEANQINTKRGGDWSEGLDNAALIEVARKFADLPAAIELTSSGKRFGVVHAGIPPRMSWKKVSQQLGDPERPFYKRNALAYKLSWFRKRLKKGITDPIKGLDTLFVGHTIHEKVTQVGNTVYLDTGAYGAHYKNGRTEKIVPTLSCAVVSHGAFKIKSVPSEAVDAKRRFKAA